MEFQISYELYRTDNINETVKGRNDGDFESEQEARETTENFLASLYDGDEWVLHSLEVTANA